MSDTLTYVTFTLACGHLTGGYAWDIMNTARFECYACKTSREWVTFTPADQGYNLYCRDCRYRRTYGMAPETAAIKVASHAVRKRHTVELRLDRHTLRVVQSAEQPLPTGEAPF